MPTDYKTKRARKSNSFVSVIISWLGRMVFSKPFEDDTLNLANDIRQISALLYTEADSLPTEP